MAPSNKETEDAIKWLRKRAARDKNAKIVLALLERALRKLYPPSGDMLKAAIAEFDRLGDGVYPAIPEADMASILRKAIEAILEEKL